MADRFCSGCGAPRKPSARFCASCGARFDGVEQQTPVGAAAPAGQQPSWQVIVGDQMPAAQPAAVHISPPAPPQAPPQAPPHHGPAPGYGEQRKGASLRTPAMSMAVAAVLEVMMTSNVANPEARTGAMIRAGAAVVPALTSLMAGSKRGVMSKVAMVSSLLLGLFQGAMLGLAGKSLSEDWSQLSQAGPYLMPQVLSFVAAFRTAWLARR